MDRIQREYDSLSPEARREHPFFSGIIIGGFANKAHITFVWPSTGDYSLISAGRAEPDQYGARAPRTLRLGRSAVEGAARYCKDDRT